MQVKKEHHVDFLLFFCEYFVGTEGSYTLILANALNSCGFW